MKKYRVTLTTEERAMLGDLVSVGKAAARKITHARILLLADEHSEAGGADGRGHRQGVAGRHGHGRTGSPSFGGTRT